MNIYIYMDRLILFRFHKNPGVCANRIRLLTNLNPDCRIVGLGENIDGIDNMFNAGMSSLYTLDDYDDKWCWLNGDLAMFEWYREEGKHIDFDMLHLIEWDLVLLKSLDKIYSGIEEIGLTGKIDIRRAKEREWNWALSDDYMYLRNQIGSSNGAYGCLFPGCCFCKEFLDEVSNLDIPELCNDEARIGLLSYKYDYDVKDTGFFDWEYPRCPLFNCANIEPSREEVLSSERDVYHPIRRNIVI